MFSVGHLIFILLSAIAVVMGAGFCLIRRPSTEQVLKSCLILCVLSEIVKFFSEIRILPMVRPVVSTESGEAILTYVPTGQYTPYLEIAHLPFELCSLMILFISLTFFIKKPEWKEKLYTLMYITGTVGGILGILLAYITSVYDTTAQYLTSPRIWQYFAFHAMLLVLGFYLGFVRKNSISGADFKDVILMLIALDIPTFFLNSLLSQPVYTEGKPTGIVYRANFFSSYANPLGLPLTEKWQWMAYLCVRFGMALLVVRGLLMLPGIIRKMRKEI